ncbi:hypothetical protein Hypma_013139 [Hypsizygus marmoreus]|uniref:Uncharacterized protein n=1 Tax=Hypsizygus marmoreus TaxID=39966 RepID=A0A369JDQ5_HYPMA|nr:hypothetical protein Hypma_013139 [Hypsizygus marmoreus]
MLHIPYLLIEASYASHTLYGLDVALGLPETGPVRAIYDHATVNLQGVEAKMVKSYKLFTPNERY